MQASPSFPLLAIAFNMLFASKSSVIRVSESKSRSMDKGKLKSACDIIKIRIGG